MFLPDEEHLRHEAFLQAALEGLSHTFEQMLWDCKVTASECTKLMDELRGRLHESFHKWRVDAQNQARTQSREGQNSTDDSQDFRKPQWVQCELSGKTSVLWANDDFTKLEHRDSSGRSSTYLFKSKAQTFATQMLWNGNRHASVHIIEQLGKQELRGGGYERLNKVFTRPKTGDGKKFWKKFIRTVEQGIVKLDVP